MAADPLAAALEAMEGAHAAPQPAKPTGLDAALSAMESVDREKTADLSAATYRASFLEPNRAARVAKVASEARLSLRLVDDNLDAVEREMAAKRWDPQELQRSSPGVADWMASSAENAAVGRPHVEALSRLEKYLGNPWDGVVQGTHQIQQARLAYYAKERGMDPEAIPGYAQERRAAETDLRASEKAFSARAIEGGASLIPQLVYGGASAGTGYAAGSIAAWGLTEWLGAGALAAAFPEVSIPAALVASLPAIGATLGAMWPTYQMESANGYAEILDTAKRENIPMDRADAAAMSDLIGMANAGLELAPLGILAKNARGLFGADAARRELVKNLLTRPTMTRALQRGVMAYAATYAPEVLTEGLQRAVTVVGAQESLREAGGTPDFGSIPGESLREMQGAAVSFLLVGASGGAGEFMQSAREASRAELSMRRAQEAASILSGTGLPEMAPDQTAALIRSIGHASEEAPENVYVPAHALVTLFQKKGASSTGPRGSQLPSDVTTDPRGLADYIATHGGIEENQKGGLTGEVAMLNQNYPDREDYGALARARRGKRRKDGQEGRRLPETRARKQSITRPGGMSLDAWAEELAGEGQFQGDRTAAYEWLTNEFVTGAQQKTGPTTDDQYAASYARYEATRATAIDPEALRSAEAIATQVLGPQGAAQFHQALSTGADLVIPYHDFMGKLAATKAGEGILHAVRFGENAMTMQEAEAWNKQADDQVAQLVAQVKETERAATTAHAGQGAGAFDALEEQLQATAGYSRATARAYAQVHRSFFETMAARWNRELPEGAEGVTAEELFRATTLQVGTATQAQAGGFAQKIHVQPEVTHANPSAPAGDRWISDRGAIPGEPSQYLDTTDGDFDSAAAAITETEVSGGSVWVATDGEGDEIGTFTTTKEAASAAERYVDGGNKPLGQSALPGMESAAIAADEHAAGVDKLRQQDAAIEAARTKDAKAGQGSLLDAEVNRRIADEGKAKAQDASDAAAQGKLFQGENERILGYFQRHAASMEIGILEGANLSTFLHETGHYFLEVMGDLAYRDDAPAQFVEDYAAVLDWLGVRTRDEIATKHHEQFARGFEAYLLEGKTPSKGLAGAFRLFRAWLSQVYKSLQALDVQLTDEVRGVFDRLLASDAELDRIGRRGGYGPIAETQQDVAATDAEWSAYQRTLDAADAEAQADLDRRLMDDQARTVKAWYREERARIEAEVTTEFDARPGARALAWLRDGTLRPGEVTPTFLLNEIGQPLKISGPALDDMLGPEAKGVRAKLNAFIVERGGIHPDILAGAFGSQSGWEFVAELLGSLNRDSAIRRETNQRMKQKYPGVLDGGRLAEAGTIATHSSKARLRQFLTELRFLSRSARRGAPPTNLDALTIATREAISGKRVRELNSGAYRRAEESAGREAIKAAAKGDFETARAAKIRQIQNHVLVAETERAREEVDSARRAIVRISSPASLARIAKTDAMGDSTYSYFAEVAELLDRFEIRKATGKELERRAGLRAWVEAERGAGRDPIVPEKLLDEAYRTNWSELTVDELVGLKDCLQNIAHLALRKRTLLLKGRKYDFESLRTRLLEQLQRGYPGKKTTSELDPARTALTGSWDALANFGASLTKREEMIRRADEDGIGVWTETVMEPIAAAQHEENDLNRDYAIRLGEAFAKMPIEQRKRMQERVRLRTIGQDVRREWLMAVACNTGNDSNMSKLLGGVPRGVSRWDADVVEEILSNLTREEWTTVQAVWDTLESLWPKIAEMERRLTGLAPPKVEHRAFRRTLADGSTIDLSGGYFPLRYQDRARMSEETIAAQLFEKNYTRAITPHGHTIKRVENFTAPLEFDLEIIPKHVSQVIHDLTHREALTQLWRVLSDPQVAEALEATMGEAEQRQFLPWLRAIANDRNDIGDLAGFFSALRRNSAVAAMGFKATTAFQNIANASNAIEFIGPKYFAIGLNKATNGAGGFEAMVASVKAKSGEMRHRWNQMDRDVRDVVKAGLGKHGARRMLAKSREIAFYGIAITDAMVTYPLWLGAYQKAADEGLNEEHSIASADRAVRLAMGTGASKDLSAIQRNNEALKWVTQFYSYFNVVFNRFSALKHDAWKSKQAGRITADLPRFLARYLFLAVIPALLSELLSDRGPDDDEDKAEWALRKSVLYPVMTVPVLRDVASYLDSGYDPKIGPLGRALGEVTQAIQTSKAYAAGDAENDKLVKQWLDVAGYATGIPSGQASITGGAVWDWIEGDDTPASFIDGAHDLLYRRKDAPK